MEDFTCEYCLEKFKSKGYIYKHQKTTKYCLKYRNIMFSCKLCNFRTVGIKNIENHIETCKGINVETETETKTTNENTIKNNTEINSLLERIENKIDELLSIKNNIIEDEKSKVENIVENVCKKSPYSPKSKKTQYKNIKNAIELIEEPSQDVINDKIKKVNDYYDNIKKNFTNTDECADIIIKSFENIKDTTNYSKLFDTLRKTKNKIMNSIEINSYITMLNEHVNILISIFKSKDYSDKKIITNITKTMSSLDLRLIRYGNYVTTELDVDDLQKLKESLFYFNNFKPSYEIFNTEKIFNKFYNYGSVIFTFKELIENYLFNPYDFNNIIYVPLKQSSDNDPYSFYTLDSINKEKRCWKMDCRLEEFSNNFIYCIRPYLINCFRDMYYDTFHDNQYRKNYNETNYTTKTDCEQLLQNIYFIIDPKSFCNYLRELVKEKSSYNPTENDKFDLYGDDVIQKKKFLTKEKIDVTCIIKMMFDGITSEEAVDFYRSKNY